MPRATKTKLLEDEVNRLRRRVAELERQQRDEADVAVATVGRVNGKDRAQQGSASDVLIASTDIRDRHEHVSGLRSAITERRQAEQATQEAEPRFRALLESAPDAMVVVDRDGSIVLVNAQTERMFGYAREEFMGQPVEMLISPRFRDSHQIQREQYNENPTVRPMGEKLELWGFRKNGDEFPVEISLSPIDTQEGGLVASAIRDITERKRAEQVLRESEARYRRLADLMPTAMYQCDIEGRITYFNKQAAKIWGREPKIHDFDERFCGSFRLYRSDGSLMLHEDSPMRAAVNEGQSFRNQEVVFERPDGSCTTVLVNIDPMDDASGRRIGAINVFFDVTELRQAQDALQESEERLNLAVRGTLDGLWDSDLASGREYWSPRFKEMLGYGEDEIEATFDQFAALLHPEDRTDALEAIRLHLEDNRPYDREFRMQTKCGEYRWFQSRGEALRDDNGKPYRVAGSIRDITDRRRAEEELRELQEKLAHVARLSTMGEMAAGIAHELNQPLTAIATYSHIVKQLLDVSAVDRQEIQRTLDKLENQTLRAGDIIWRLRNFANKSPSHRVPTDLNVLVNDVGRFVEPDLREANVSLQLSLDETCLSSLVDVIQIQQVLVNLIRNAIDAMVETPIDRRTVTVATRACEDNRLEVSVCDAGKGLNRDEFDLVFDAFYSTKQQGMGMGLAISRSIIEDHDGRLWGEANHTAGATFRFTIPRGTNHAEPD